MTVSKPFPLLRPNRRANANPEAGEVGSMRTRAAGAVAVVKRNWLDPAVDWRTRAAVADLEAHHQPNGLHGPEANPVDDAQLVLEVQNVLVPLSASLPSPSART